MSYQCGTVSITYKNIIVSQNFFWEGEKKTLTKCITCKIEIEKWQILLNVVHNSR